MSEPRLSRLLAVDNEPGMLEVVCESLLRLPGVEVVGEVSSQAAAELLGRESFDLLITDLRMPKLSGLELIELARRLAPEMPILVLTAYPMAETAQRCRDLGTLGYLRKPIDPLVLMAEVQLVLTRSPEDLGP